MTSTTVSIVRDLPASLIRTRLHLVACVLACLWGWAQVAGMSPSAADYLVVSLAITFIYQWNRLTDAREDRRNCPTDLATVVERRPWIVALAVLSLLGCLAAAVPGAPVSAVALLALTVVFGYLYSSPPLPGRPETRLKNLLLTKNLVPAFGWSNLAVLYPALSQKQALTLPLWVAYAAMFSVVFAIEVLWDVRDQPGDRAAGIRSLPLVLGCAGTTRLFDLVNGGVALAIAVLVGTENLPAFWLFFLLNSVILTLWIRLAFRRPESRLPSHLLILLESAMILVFGLLAKISDALPPHLPG